MTRQEILDKYGVKDPFESESDQLEMVKKNPFNVLLIREPNEKVQLEASKDPRTFVRIRNPTKEVQMAVVMHGSLSPMCINLITDLEALEAFCKLLSVTKIMDE